MSSASDDSGRDSPAPNAAEPEGLTPGSAAAGIAGMERAFLRLTFWQTVLSLAGVFVGAVALYAALNESQAVRQQTAAAVWPYVQVMINDTDDGTDAYFALAVENVGVGPARMRGMQLSFGDEAVLSWDAAALELLGESMRVGVDFGRSSVSNRVIAPGESVVAFHTSDVRLARAMQTAVQSGDVRLDYCFCSIFDQCWLSGVPAVDSASPQSVESCPDFAAGAFQD